MQRKPFPARVVWARTHVVREIDGSIFGGEDYREGEIGALGEVEEGDALVIDDDDIFISRRGANQENAKIRAQQRDTIPSFEWIRVLSIGDENLIGKNVYIRAETIAIIREKSERKSTAPRREIVIREALWSDEIITSSAKNIGEEWADIREGGEKPKEEYECSGITWGQGEEGVDVARDLACPEEREQDPDGEYEKTFLAYYKGEEKGEPIAIMQLEMRSEDLKAEGVKHLYIRWLLGSPRRRGGGSSLIELAKSEAVKVAEGQLRVESAFSAEEWYQKQGFVTRYNSRHVDSLHECRCKFMTWIGL